MQIALHIPKQDAPRRTDVLEAVARAVVKLCLDERMATDPEFRAAIIGYLEWGTRLAMQNSKPGAEVVPEAPVPHWGWGVAPPYLG